MRMSGDHILTSHAGSLPRPDELIEANRAFHENKSIDENQFQSVLGAAVGDVVRRQLAKAACGVAGN